MIKILAPPSFVKGLILSIYEQYWNPDQSYNPNPNFNSGPYITTTTIKPITPNPGLSCQERESEHERSITKLNERITKLKMRCQNKDDIIQSFSTPDHTVTPNESCWPSFTNKSADLYGQSSVNIDCAIVLSHQPD